MRLLAGIAVLLGCFAQAPLASPLDHTLWDVQSRRQIDVPDLVRIARQADVVMLGEVHDNALIHEAQARLVRLVEADALAVEMIPVELEPDVLAHLSRGGSADEIGRIVDWDARGWPAWAQYRSIFQSDTLEIVTGAALSRDVAMKIMREGTGAAEIGGTPAEALASPLPADQQAAAEAEMVDVHCGHLSAEMAPGMVAVQRARDASLAAAVLRARQRGGRLVAVIAGNGHVRSDRGVPVYLPDDIVVLTIGILEPDPDISSREVFDETHPYDFLWFQPRAEREDPCARFKKG